MIGLVITGHGQFASGLVSALHLLIGRQDQMTAVDFESGQSSEELMKKLQKTVDAMPACKEILVLCDMIGGSPYQCASKLAAACPAITVLYGINLGMALELALRCRMGLDHDVGMLVDEMIETGKAQIGKFTPEAPFS